MWLLGRILPIVIGDMIPSEDEKWTNFRLLMEIVDILFAPKISADLVGYLSTIIAEHHGRFRELYPVIPKMHFIVHMPRLAYK